MKNANYRHIVSFIVLNNSFVDTEDIVRNQILKTGLNLGAVTLYVSSTLRRLEKRGQIVSCRAGLFGKKTWGLPNWLDVNNQPQKSHCYKKVIF